MSILAKVMTMRLKSNQELLEDLRKLAEKLGRTPTITEARNCPDMAAIATYYNRFGSWVNALKLAGLTPPNSDEKLIADLRKLAEKLGRTPTTTEVDECPDMAATTTYCTRFGSWVNALELAGLTSRRKPK